ncbi:MAG: ATP-dependent DNA ligase [Lewinellaceae bacterium]|nr:ATP-dependent DNA ligase [Phaeodactylibacter sp.]MCB0612519.1 ATP-dependent DNA ligase [Phaeodactylibacter sp.]MCB9346911.1 ATP-dependent DNA ligase [Lewinellaceae bacterium]
MKHFASLYTQLDQTTKTNAKVSALAQYFEQASDEDQLWTVAILSHRRPKRTVNSTLLRTWAAEMADIPLWLFEESYHVVGDLSEAIALTLPRPQVENTHSLTYWIEYIKSLDKLEETEKKERICAAWQSMDYTERLVFNKLITGGFRIGVSQKLMVRALSQYTAIDEDILAHRIMGNWDPSETSFESLILTRNPLEDISKPYPFYLAYALEEEPEALGAPADWAAERKWDGIRGQLIVRENELFVWSRGEELVTDKFPEFHPLAELLPNGAVIDGEILPFKDGRPLTFNDLQTRIGRKNVSKSILKKTPVAMMAYDLLEWQGEDIRHYPFQERRRLLEEMMANCDTQGILLLSEALAFHTWAELVTERENSREHHSEGLMLKRKDAPYQSGRKKGGWWKWKIDPLAIDAVMIYAQRGHGRRANLFTDFTFAVWDGNTLVPFAKAYSGLTDKEFQEITAWVRRNTRERFGPVHSVEPTFVFEIAFEGIRASTRHKSGVALRFPRISRWRKDKTVREANTLEDLKEMLRVYEG